MHGHPEANLFDGVFIDFHTLYIRAGKALTRLRTNAISTKSSCAGVIMLDRGDVKAGLRLCCLLASSMTFLSDIKSHECYFIISLTVLMF